MAVSLVPIGPGLPPGLAAILKSHEDAIRAAQQPQAPVQMASIDTAANLVARAPASDYRGCAIIVTDKQCLAISVNVAGTWTWVRADGSAL
jgi:hypothetical protein